MSKPITRGPCPTVFPDGWQIRFDANGEGFVYATPPVLCTAVWGAISYLRLRSGAVDLNGADWRTTVITADTWDSYKADPDPTTIDGMVECCRVERFRKRLLCRGASTPPSVHKDAIGALNCIMWSMLFDYSLTPEPAPEPAPEKPKRRDRTPVELVELIGRNIRSVYRPHDTLTCTGMQRYSEGKFHVTSFGSTLDQMWCEYQDDDGNWHPVQVQEVDHD